jgi:hypothetical protein
MRQLSAAQQALLYALAMQAADEGRAGWVPIEDGETAADALVRRYRPAETSALQPCEHRHHWIGLNS